MKNVTIAIVGIAAAIGLIGFSVNRFFSQDQSAETTESLQDVGRMIVFTSILPQEYFVERIGDGRVHVQALVTPGSSPATYEPTPRQMADLSEAKLFFRIGVPFEKAFIPKIEGASPGLRIVDTRRGSRSLETIRTSGSALSWSRCKHAPSPMH